MRNFNSLEDEGRFFTWTDSLTDRVTRARLDKSLRKEVASALAQRAGNNDALLSKLNHAEMPEILRADVVRALLVLDGTLRMTGLDGDGRPEVA